MSMAMYNVLNNTPQAYSAVRCRDAQTGGLLISGAGKPYAMRIISRDTPAMPLKDAHFGGFFVSSRHGELLSHQKTEEGKSSLRIIGLLSHG